MNEEQLLQTVPQLKRFLQYSLIRWAVVLVNAVVSLPLAVGIVAMVTIIFTPLVSLWFLWPVAKLLQRSMAFVFVVTLFFPFGYLISGNFMLRDAKSMPCS